MTPAEQNDIQARKLAKLSRIFGLGGLGALLVLTPVFYLLTDDILIGMGIGGLGAMSIFTGAILGQISRGLQGRVI